MALGRIHLLFQAFFGKASDSFLILSWGYRPFVIPMGGYLFLSFFYFTIIAYFYSHQQPIFDFPSFSLQQDQILVRLLHPSSLSFAHQNYCCHSHPSQTTEILPLSGIPDQQLPVWEDRGCCPSVQDQPLFPKPSTPTFVNTIVGNHGRGSHNPCCEYAGFWVEMVIGRVFDIRRENIVNPAVHALDIFQFLRPN